MIYTQYQRFIATLLLFTLLLQSCGTNLNLEAEAAHLETRSKATKHDKSSGVALAALSTALPAEGSNKPYSSLDSELSGVLADSLLHEASSAPVPSVAHSTPQRSPASLPTPRPTTGTKEPGARTFNKPGRAVLDRASMARRVQDKPTQTAGSVPAPIASAPGSVHCPKFPSKAVPQAPALYGPFATSCGAQVVCSQADGQWTARVKESIGSCSREMTLPIVCIADIGASLESFQGKQPLAIKSHIHVLDGAPAPYAPKYVYIGQQGLKGGMQKGEEEKKEEEELSWCEGPRLQMGGNNSRTLVHHIPEGYSYKDYKAEKWDISPKRATCGIMYVTADAKYKIDELSQHNDVNALQGALKANFLEVVDVAGVGVETTSAHARGQQGSVAAAHTHSALVLHGSTEKGRVWGSKDGRIDVSTKICLQRKANRPSKPSGSVHAPLSTPPPLPPRMRIQKPSLEEVELHRPLEAAPLLTAKKLADPVSMNKPQGEDVDLHHPLEAARPLRGAKKLANPVRTPKPQEEEVDLTVPAEAACPLIGKKLADPACVLSESESIDLLTTCVRYGNKYSEKILDKDAVIVIGNTGAGKSTFVNYLSGCEMELKEPEELDDMLDSMVVVKSKAAGGRYDEIMAIGHTKQSKTFMPQIEEAPEDGFTYCDCPGFLDNRGAEINIANAVNIKTALKRAKSVKVIILINYHSLKADRGRGLTDMINICSTLFGNASNLARYKDSLLLCVSQAPIEMNINKLKAWITRDTPEIMEVLAGRLFLSDPLERGGVGFWSREQCLAQISELSSIEHPDRIFQTVLTDTDEKQLVRIVEHMGKEIQDLVEQGDFSGSQGRLSHLKGLSVIDNITVERLLMGTRLRLQNSFQKRVDAYKEHCHFENFSLAGQLLKELAAIGEYFAPEDHNLDMDSLRNYYTASEARYRARKAQEEETRAKLRAAQGRIEELIALIEAQKQATQRQIKEQTSRFNELLGEMRASMEQSSKAYDEREAQIVAERDETLRRKEEELLLGKALSAQEKRQLEKERQALEETYASQLQAAEQEKAAFIAAQQAAQAQREAQRDKEQAKLLEQLAKLEEQHKEQEAALAATTVPVGAFGKQAWEQYFGEVGEEPALPSDIGAILKSPCPFWPGKEVGDTHLLVLIPATVNGRPFSLDLLGELIQSPGSGGHRTQYRNYWEEAQKALGTQSPSSSRWVLMTRDVIPDSRDKSYSKQASLVAEHAQRTGIKYALPHVLEAATAILLEHVRTGQRLYSDSPYTYTRCQEEVQGWRVVVGGFSSGGLYIFDDSRILNGHGVACLRKF